MKLKAIVHSADEGGYWAEVPSIPGCATQGASMGELLKNIEEAVEGCLSVDVQPAALPKEAKVMEIALHLTAAAPQPGFKFGMLAGKVGTPPDFFEPMPPEELADWEGRHDSGVA